MLASGAVSAIEKVPAGNSQSGHNLPLPARAIEVAPHVFSLGQAIDPEQGDMVEGLAIVHPKKIEVKPTAKPDKNSRPSACYAFLAKDAKWKTVEPWLINTANSYGLTADSIFSILTDSITKWENAAKADILGNGSVTANDLLADLSYPDTLNEVYFGPLDDGAIAMTVIWGIFDGTPKTRELREWDQIYNSLYTWSDTGATDAMDFENIATHELGHSAGMGDLYDSACGEETMFGYATWGETIKRTLNAGDLFGIGKLY